MNILEAKQEMEYTIRAYLRKDEAGEYAFPAIRQRPLLLMGPPGIGKTAIMEQIASGMGIGLVSYTMTHHTRQSAIGLPQIKEQSFDGVVHSVTRYTMSEIIASVYDEMANTGCREGILFLDEINCVSDTLAPTMLQFLQNKTFGTHHLPEGWVIVAAGNPPEYNKSVREFDVVTLDRVRTITVEPNTEVFLRYGQERGLHGAVLSYLRLNPQAFYHVSRQENRLYYVTARGWEDLSALLLSYESMEIPVSEEVICQFLCLPETGRAFYAYYSLYRKYGMDYGIPEILSGSLPEKEYNVLRGMAARGDTVERFAGCEMLLQGMRSACLAFSREDEKLTALHTALKAHLDQGGDFEAFTARRREAAETKKKYGLLKGADLRLEEAVLSNLEAMVPEWKHQRGADQDDVLRQLFAEKSAGQTARRDAAQTALSRGICFLRESLGDGQELTALLSGMTASPEIMRFTARFGCPEYLAVCDRLRFRANEEELKEQCRRAMG